MPLFRETLSHGIVIAAQSKADAERFMSLGASAARTRVIGNIKFDKKLDDDIVDRGLRFRRDTFGQRPVWIAASTHEGEEEALLAAHQALLQEYPDLLLVLVPRHPERFSVVAELIRRTGLRHIARTEHRPCQPDTQVFLGDTMGEMMTFYAAGDIAFVAGSLVPIGGHNLLEPGALGMPIITGPHVFNAEEIAEMFLSRGACRMVHDSDELAGVIAHLLKDEDEARALGQAAQQIIVENRGSLSQLLELVVPLIDEPPPA